MDSPSKTSYSVIVLGDAETVGLSDLGEKAAEQGAVITETFAFAPGEAVSHDDLTEVDAVVDALSRAISTRVDIWVPFPLADLGREQHVRRVSLVLQRHGLNMLMGRELNPCTQDGGFSEIDFALRAEVRAVDGLDCAALAVSGAATLAEEIEQALRRTDPPRRTSSVPPPEVRCSGAVLRNRGRGEVLRQVGAVGEPGLTYERVHPCGRIADRTDPHRRHPGQAAVHRADAARYGSVVLPPGHPRRGRIPGSPCRAGLGRAGIALIRARPAAYRRHHR